MLSIIIFRNIKYQILKGQRELNPFQLFQNRVFLTLWLKLFFIICDKTSCPEYQNHNAGKELGLTVKMLVEMSAFCIRGPGFEVPARAPDSSFQLTRHLEAALIALVVGFLPQIKVLASSFVLAQFWLLQPFGE